VQRLLRKQRMEETLHFAQSFFELTAASVRLADCNDCFAIVT